MIDQIIQVILTVLIPGIILAYLKQKMDIHGPKLVYYINAANWFTGIDTRPLEQQRANQALPPLNIHAITIAIKNNGNQVAKNVDISLFQWPNHFQVVPYISYEILPLDQEPKRIIRLKSLNPGETVWVSFLFTSIVNENTFIEYVRSEEVVGMRTNMILNQVFPIHLTWLVAILMILGLVFIGFIIWWFYPPAVFFIKALISFPR